MADSPMTERQGERIIELLEKIEKHLDELEQDSYQLRGYAERVADNTENSDD